MVRIGYPAVATAAGGARHGHAKRMLDTYPLSFTVWVMPTRDGQANQLWVHNWDQPAIDAVMGG
jgi:hypothetical protein